MPAAQSNADWSAIKLATHVRQRGTPSNCLSGPRLPQMIHSFAKDDITLGVVAATWFHIVWALAPDKDNAINRVLSIINSPLHGLFESLTIAKIFNGIRKMLCERRRTRALSPRFLKHGIQWVFDDVRTVWQLVCGVFLLFIQTLTPIKAHPRGLPC